MGFAIRLGPKSGKPRTHIGLKRSDEGRPKEGDSRLTLSAISIGWRFAASLCLVLHDPIDAIASLKVVTIC